MPNLKEVRNRIGSVQSTMQITSAMKMVSAAKLRRAQDAVQRLRPYASKLQEILGNLSGSLDTDEGVYAQQREVRNVLLIPVTSNRGLCGSFNATIIRETNNLIKQYKGGHAVTVLAIGKKADDFFKRTEYNIKGTTLPGKLNTLFDNLDWDHVAPVAQKIMDAFEHKQFDKVYVIYNAFKNAAVQEVRREQFLPIVPVESNDSAAVAGDYIFEPGKSQIVTELVPKSLKTQFYAALLDSHAAEHGARMTAMHKATDNAGDLLDALKLSYNKARQAAITGEILEIVGGAEALEG